MDEKTGNFKRYKPQKLEVVDPSNLLETELQAIGLPFALQFLQPTSSTETLTITAASQFAAVLSFFPAIRPLKNFYARFI